MYGIRQYRKQAFKLGRAPRHLVVVLGLLALMELLGPGMLAARCGRRYANGCPHQRPSPRAAR
jgi:hypothetical protein